MGHYTLYSEYLFKEERNICNHITTTEVILINTQLYEN